MDVHTLPGAALALSHDVDRLTKGVIEHLHDPVLVGDAALDASISLILDRLFLSIRLSKPVGLGTWAMREAHRIGTARTLEVANAAAHVIAGEAVEFPIDHGRLLAFLEILKNEIHASLYAVDDGCGVESAVRRPYSETAHALLTMLGERDSLTCCHSKATAEWARRLSAAMHLGDEQSAFIELCAVLHDIGKVATPEEILFKPGPLTPEEWNVMRDHSAAGQRILSQIPTLARSATIVRAHHERWDGLGYPDALAGEAIPFEARVIAVADAFHAMISDRPYRRAIAPRRALEILEAGSGTQWDSTVVEAMMSLFSRTARKTAQRHASSA